MNPYAKFIGDRVPLDILRSTSARLTELLSKLGDSGADRPWAPGKWSSREILAHLADCEIVFAFRLRQTLAEDHHMIQPFDQDAWSKSYAGVDAKSALAVFIAVRHWNLQLIDSVPPQAFSKPNTHPERGPGSFGNIVETMAGHDINHLNQIEAVAVQAA